MKRAALRWLAALVGIFGVLWLVLNAAGTVWSAPLALLITIVALAQVRLT